MDEWGDTSILSKQSARIAGRPDIGSMDNKPHRKLKITQQGLDALRKDRDRPKVKTQVKITKKGRDAVESKLPPHLSKFLDKDGNPNKEAQARMDAGRKKRAAAAAKPKITDVTPKGYGPNEGIVDKAVDKAVGVTVKVAKKHGGYSNKDIRGGAKLMKTDPGGALDQVGAPKNRLTKAVAQRVAKSKTVQKALHKHTSEGRFASAASDPRIGGSSSVDTVPDFAIKAKKGATSAPGSGSIAKAKKAKASDVNKSIEQQMADALKEAGSKWAQNFKANARKRLGATKQRQSENPPSARDDAKDLLDPHRKYKAMKKSLRGEDTNRYWHTIREAQWKVKLKGLPTFYVPGKSVGEIRQMLRKQLKRPMDDIEDITRATPAAKKKDFRNRAQGHEDEKAVVSGKS